MFVAATTMNKATPSKIDSRGIGSDGARDFGAAGFAGSSGVAGLSVGSALIAGALMVAR
jgi:hypothetical protein